MAAGMTYERRPSRAWHITTAVCAAVALVAGGLGFVTQLPLWWLLVALAVGIAVPCLLHEGLTSRSVTADEDALWVQSRWRSRRVNWNQMRRVRRAGASSFPRQGDMFVERADGTLLPLPPEVPGGTVDGWRERVGGARPSDELPQTWLRSDAYPNLLWPLWVMPLVLQVALRLIDGDRDWVFIAAFALLAGVAAGLTFLTRRRPPGVVADDGGLMVRSLRSHRIAWSDVREIRPVDRFDATAVVVLADGTTRTLPDVPVDVAEHWRALAIDPRT